MLTIAIQQALHCLASSHLEHGMVQQIHSSTALPRFLPREVGQNQNTDLAETVAAESRFDMRKEVIA